jgi:hypothetical protein
MSTTSPPDRHRRSPGDDRHGDTPRRQVPGEVQRAERQVAADQHDLRGHQMRSHRIEHHAMAVAWQRHQHGFGASERISTARSHTEPELALDRARGDEQRTLG